MSYYAQELVEEIRSRSDIVDVISGYVKLQRKGSNYVGVCPFHNDRNPSMSVNQPRQMYHCFSCGAGGDVFKFVMDYENLTFPEAVKVLADRAGIELPEQDYSPEARKQADLKEQIMELNRLAGKYYYYMLRQPDGKQGVAVLQGPFPAVGGDNRLVIMVTSTVQIQADEVFCLVYNRLIPCVIFAAFRLWGFSSYFVCGAAAEKEHRKNDSQNYQRWLNRHI